MPAPPASSPGQPASLVAAHATEGKTAAGALRLWFAAAFLYGSADPAEQAAGREALNHLTIPFKDAPDWERRPSYGTFRERLRGSPHIFRSYCRGATPDNGYAADPRGFELVIEKQDPPGARGVAVHLRSGGADRARPVYMKASEQTGLWYVSSFDNVYLDVRPARQPGKETFR